MAGAVYVNLDEVSGPGIDAQFIEAFAQAFREGKHCGLEAEATRGQGHISVNGVRCQPMAWSGDGAAKLPPDVLNDRSKPRAFRGEIFRFKGGGVFIGAQKGKPGIIPEGVGVEVPALGAIQPESFFGQGLAP